MPPNDALLLIAHGSARYPQAGRVAQAHLDRIRQADPEREVALGLLNGEPSVAQALAGLTAPVIRVVPFFMEAGYFTQVAVPRALESCPPDRLRIAKPVGMHHGMAGLITACALDGCAAFGIDPTRLAVLVVGHGSARAPGRPLALYRHAAGAAGSGAFASVTAGCLEEPPFLADMLRGLRDHPVGLVGFFAGEGGHVRDDVPALVAAEQDGRGPNAPPVFNFGSVSENPAMVRIILAQADAT